MGYLVGGFMSGISSLMQGQNDAANEEERGNVARFNAKVAEQQAKSEMEAAAADSSDYRRQMSARVATSRAVAAGSGFLLEGSPMMVNEAAVSEIEFGAARIIGNARIKAARLRTESSLLKREGMVDDRNANNARQAGVLGFFTGLASGATNMYRSTLTTRPAPAFGA